MSASLYIPVIDNGMGLSRTQWAMCMFTLGLSGFMRNRQIVTEPISYPYPDGAMNIATMEFLDSGCDEMLIIDTDIVFRPMDVERLLSHDVPVVAGLYPKKRLGLEFPCQKLHRDFDANPHENPLLEVASTARGFMRIKRQVFELLAPKVDTYIDDDTGKVCRQFWKTLPGGHSEDFNFCKMWRDIGGSVYVDQRITLGHEGTAVYPIEGTY